MIIQGSGSANSLYSTLAKSSAQRQDLSISTLKPADTVTISSAAKALASVDNSTTQFITAAQERILKTASEDPQFAEKYAYEMANIPSAVVYDISASLVSQDIKDVKVAYTGRKIDQAFKDKFSTEASVIDAKRLEIYNSEKAEGTDPVMILSKMINFTNSQSRDYLEGTGWLARS